MVGNGTYSNKFDYILSIVQNLLQIKDISLLLERILTETRSISRADAGTIYLVDNNHLRFACSQNNTLQKRLAYGQKLIFETYTVPINNSSIVGYVANTGVSLNIANAYQIDSIQPYSFDPSYDQRTGYYTRSILTVPICNSKGGVVGVIQLINALNPDLTVRDFTAIEESVVQLFAYNAASAIEHARLQRSMSVIINRLIEANDARETLGHVDRVSQMVAELYDRWAQKRGLSATERQSYRDQLMVAARFHDVGKAIACSCIHKMQLDGDKTLEETGEAGVDSGWTAETQWSVIEGARLLNCLEIEQLDLAQEIVMQYHECWDGTGYPGYIDITSGAPLVGYDRGDGTAFRRRGEEIAPAARILAVVHEYDMLTHELVDGVERPVDAERRKAALDKIASYSGSRFDPGVVSILVGYLEHLTKLDDLSG